MQETSLAKSDYNNLYSSENHPRHMMVSADCMRARAEKTRCCISLKSHGALALLLLLFCSFKSFSNKVFQNRKYMLSMTVSCETPSSGHVKTSMVCSSLSPSTQAQIHQYCSLQLNTVTCILQGALVPCLPQCLFPLLLGMRSVGPLSDKVCLLAVLLECQGWNVGH